MDPLHYITTNYNPNLNKLTLQSESNLPPDATSAITFFHKTHKREPNLPPDSTSAMPLSFSQLTSSSSTYLSSSHKFLP